MSSEDNMTVVVQKTTTINISPEVLSQLIVDFVTVQYDVEVDTSMINFNYEYDTDDFVSFSGVSIRKVEAQ